MLHCRDDIGQVMNSAWFPSGMTLGIQTKDSNLCFISPKNFVSHGRRVLQVPFGKLVLLRSDYSVWPLCHTGVICSICISQVGRAVSSRKSPGEFKFLQFMDGGGHCVHWDLQCSRNFSVPFPRSVPWYNSLDFTAWFVLWHDQSAMGPYINKCVPFQIMFNQLNLPQVDSSQVLEKSSRWSVETDQLNTPELAFECPGNSNALFLYNRTCTLTDLWPCSPIHNKLRHSFGGFF